MDNRVPAGVGAETFERPSECHTRQPILKVSTTGAKYWDSPRRRPLEEVTPKHPECITGLRAFDMGSVLWLEWIRQEPIDEADARDAQCRAGWSDYACGFWEFKTIALPSGSHVAVWKCGKSRE